MTLPAEIRKLNMMGARVGPVSLAQIATLLEQHGAVVVVGAYIDPHGAGRGALELGKSFAGYLSDRAAIRVKMEQIMGHAWMEHHRDQSLRDQFDAFTAASLAMIAEVDAVQSKGETA